MVDCLRIMQDYISANATHCCGVFSSSATRATDLIGKLGDHSFLALCLLQIWVQHQCISLYGRIEQCSLASLSRLGTFTSGEVMDEIYKLGSFRTAKQGLTFAVFFSRHASVFTFIDSSDEPSLVFYSVFEELLILFE